MCDIPSHGDEALEVFEDRSLQTPQQSPQGVAAAAAAAANAGAGGSPKSRGGAGEALDTSSPPTAKNPGGGGGGGVTDGAAERFRPTHVVYLEASLEQIVEQQGRRGAGTTAEAGGAAGGKEAETKLRARLERYFAQEQQAEPLEGEDPASADNAPPGDKKRRPSNHNESGGGSQGHAAPRELAGEHGHKGDRRLEEGRWIPAVARSLQDRYAIRVRVINAEDGQGGAEDALSAVVAAVDEHVCAGEVPGFVWMLSDGQHGGGTTAAGEAVKNLVEGKKLRQGSSGDGGGGADGGGGGCGEGCQPAGDEMLLYGPCNMCCREK